MDERAGKARIPPSAAWLGVLGLVPFAALAAVVPFVAGDLKSDLAYSLLAYGAIILSFLGGVHWGLAIGGTAPARAAGGPGVVPEAAHSVELCRSRVAIDRRMVRLGQLIGL